MFIGVNLLGKIFLSRLFHVLQIESYSLFTLLELSAKGEEVSMVLIATKQLIRDNYINIDHFPYAVKFLSFLPFSTLLDKTEYNKEK
jgi:hypothetical protein